MQKCCLDSGHVESHIGESYCRGDRVSYEWLAGISLLAVVSVDCVSERIFNRRGAIGWQVLVYRVH